jgi:hypothetical protein
VIEGTCDDRKNNRCPNDPEICAPDYFTCQMISKEAKEKDLSKPFKCMNND